MLVGEALHPVSIIIATGVRNDVSPLLYTPHLFTLSYLQLGEVLDHGVDGDELVA